MNKLFTIILLMAGVNIYAQNLKTVFEKSDGLQTATYTQAIDYYQELADMSDFINIRQMGLTDSGKPLHLVTLDVDKDFDFKKAHENGKTVLLINNGIHPGEPDGIEASMMLLRDYVMNSEKRALLKNIIIGVIPIYNIGGALNRNSTTRANQVGPQSYGFRGNARNFDLNRDFIKADTRNARSFHEIFHHVNPDIFIDTHVSNGADYQYSITHLATQPNKMGGDMGKYIEDEFIIKLEKSISQRGSDITPYVNVFNSTPDKQGFSQFMDSPRYSTGYTTLFGTLGFMIETHMLKPFNVRVKASYDFLETVIEIAGVDGTRIKNMRKRRMEEIKAGSTHAIAWRLNRDQYRQLNFKGYEGEMRKSEVTGKQRLYYDRKKPFEKVIPYYNTFDKSKEVTIPKAYIIPQGWYNVIDRLKTNGVVMTKLTQDTTINVERYKIIKFNTASAPFEGHYLHNEVVIEAYKQSVNFSEGDLMVSIDQPARRYLIETLEPEAPDSFFAWNFFDTILQRKEGFSPYVFEDVALKLLDEDKELKADFEKKKEEDQTFVDNWYAQLNFIYQRSVYHEPAHMQYPIFRLLD